MPCVRPVHTVVHRSGSDATHFLLSVARHFFLFARVSSIQLQRQWILFWLLNDGAYPLMCSIELVLVCWCIMSAHAKTQVRSGYSTLPTVVRSTDTWRSSSRVEIISATTYVHLNLYIHFYTFHIFVALAIHVRMFGSCCGEELRLPSKI